MWRRNLFTQSEPGNIFKGNLLIALGLLLIAILLSAFYYFNLDKPSNISSPKLKSFSKKITPSVVDTSLKVSGDGSQISSLSRAGSPNTPLPYKVSFSKDVNKPVTMSFRGSENDRGISGPTISFQPVKGVGSREADLTPKVKGNKATYYNIYPNTNLERIITPQGLKQNYILTKPGHPKSFTETIKTNLTVKLQKDGSLAYMEGSKAILATSPKPHLTDAKGKVVSLSYALSRDKLAISLPSLKGLSYPITVDPSIYGDNPGGDLVVDGMEYTITGDRQGANGYNSITVQNGGTLNIQADDTVDGAIIDITNNVLVTGNSQIIAKGYYTDSSASTYNGKGVTINATNIQVDAGSKIDASGSGYAPYAYSIENGGPGNGGQANDYWASGGGAGHGGIGGSTLGGSGGNAYAFEKIANPIDLGSAGGNKTSSNVGGAGGGAIKILSSTLVNNGVIATNGSHGNGGEIGGAAGGGSGGSIYIDTDSLLGSGSVSANGGNGGNSLQYVQGGGGAGGRIAVYYNQFEYTGIISAYGGAGYYGAQNGTIYPTPKPFNIKHDHPSSTSIKWKWQENFTTDSSVGFKIYQGSHSSEESNNLLAQIPGGSPKTGYAYYEWTQNELDSSANYSIHVHSVIDGNLSEPSKLARSVMPQDYTAININMIDQPLQSRFNYIRANWHCLPNLLLTTSSDAALAYKSLDWSALQLEVGQAIKFRIRTANSLTDLSAASWYGSGGLVLNNNDWSSNYFGQTYGQSPINSLSIVSAGQYAQIQVRLEHNATTAPTLNSLDLNYEKIPPLAPNDIKQKRADTSQEIVVGNFVNTSNILFETTNLSGVSDSTSVKAQFEIKPFIKAFNNTSLVDGSIVSPITPQGTSQRIENLVPLDYRWRVRVVDDKGRYSPWTHFGSNSIYEKDFIIDTAKPSTPGVPTTLSPTNNQTPTWIWQGSTDDSSGIKGYYFYLGTSLGATDVINGDFVANNKYTITSVLNEGTYYAFVKAADKANNLSSVSQSGELVIDFNSSPLNAPSNLIAWLEGSNVNLTWLAPLSGTVDYYNIYRSTTSITNENKNITDIIDQTANTSFVDSTALSGQTYYYGVTAVSNGAEGPITIAVINSKSGQPNQFTWTTQRDFEFNASTLGIKTNRYNIDTVSQQDNVLIANDFNSGDGGEGDLVLDGTNGANSTDGQLHDENNPYVLDGKHYFNNVTLQNGAVLTHSQKAGAGTGVEGVELYVKGDLTIDASSRIDVSGKGYMADGSSEVGSPLWPWSIKGGQGAGMNSYGLGSAGGSYGGLGGKGPTFNTSYLGLVTPSAMPTYGSVVEPEFLGSAGGSVAKGPDFSQGGSGGGRIKIVAGGVNISGSIQANGSGGGPSFIYRYDGLSYTGGAGGSGGAIYIATNSINLSGPISAAGGGGSGSNQGQSGLNGQGGDGGPSSTVSTTPGLGGAPGFAGNGGSRIGTGGFPEDGGSSAGGAGIHTATSGSAGGGTGRIAIQYGTITGGDVNGARSGYAASTSATIGPYAYYKKLASGQIGSDLSGTVGLRADAKQQVEWKNILFNATNSENVRFQIRTANTLEALDKAQYVGWNNTQDTWLDADRPDLSAIPDGRYAEILVDLQASVLASPILHDVTLSYLPSNRLNIVEASQNKVDGSLIQVGGTTNEDTVVFKAKIDGSFESTNPKAEFEIKSVEQSFNGADLFRGNVTGSDSSSTLTLPTSVLSGAQIDYSLLGYPSVPSGYTYMKRITISNNASTDLLSGFQTSAVFNHQKLVGANQSLASGDDLRVFYNNSGTLVELDRVLDMSSNWNSANTKLWFKTQNIIKSGDSDINYYIVYGNSSATNPPANANNIFAFYDDFNGSSLDATKWAEFNSSSPVVSNGTLTLTFNSRSTTSGIQSAAVVMPPVIFEQKFRINGADSGFAEGLLKDGGNFGPRTYTYQYRHLYEDKNVELFGYAGTDWHSYKETIYGSNSIYNREGYISKATLLQSKDGVNMNITLQGRGGQIWQWPPGWIDSPAYGEWDYVLARRYVTEEPTTVVDFEGISPSGQYHWRVRAVDDEGRKSTWKNFGNNHDNTSRAATDITIDINKPSIPGAPTTESPNYGKPIWNWSASTDNESGIKGYYFNLGTTPGANDVINSESVSTNSYTYSGNLPSGIYYAQVIALDNAGNASDPSSNGTVEVIVDPTLTTPSQLNVILAGQGSAQLIWKEPPSKVGYYKIYRWHKKIDDMNKPQATFIATATVNVFNDLGLAKGRTYYYQVTAINDEGQESAVSINPVSDNIKIASDEKAVWTTKEDFENNASTINMATARNNIETQSLPGAVALKPANGNFGDGSEGDLVIDGTAAANSTDGQKHDETNPYVLDGIHNFQNITIQNNGILTHSSVSGGLELLVQNKLAIDQSSLIELTGKGYGPQTGPGAAPAVKYGAGYGGVGGGYQLLWLAPTNGGSSYGQVDGSDGMQMGSGAWSSSGGGRIKIIAGYMDIKGKVEANGQGGVAGLKENYSSATIAPTGGASGGGIYLESPFLTVDGLISAAGGGGGSLGEAVVPSSNGQSGKGAYGGKGGDSFHYSSESVRMLDFIEPGGVGGVPGSPPGNGATIHDLRLPPYGGLKGGQPGGYSAGGSGAGSLFIQGGIDAFGAAGGAAGRVAIKYGVYNGKYVKSGQSGYAAPSDNEVIGPYAYYINNASFQSEGLIGDSNQNFNDDEKGLIADAKTAARWTSIDYSSAELLTGQNVQFKIRAADTIEQLKNKIFVGPSGENSWFDANNKQIPESLETGRFAELLVKLSSLGTNTPILHNITLNYDTLNQPSNLELSQSKLNGEPLATEGALKDTQLLLAADNVQGLSIAEDLRAEFEVKPIDVNFDAAGTALGSTVSSGGKSQVTITEIEGKYHWRARIIDTQGNVSAWASFGSNSDSSTPADTDFVVDTTAPSIPSTPTTETPTDDITPTFSWNAAIDNISGIKGYYVFLGTNPGASNVLNGQFITNNSFTTPSLNEGTYYLALKAQDNAENISGLSQEGSVNIAFTTASNLNAELENLSSRKVRISWSAPAGLAFNVYRSFEKITIDNLSKADKIATEVGTTNYTDDSTTPGETYYYQVTMVQNGAEGSLSTSIQNDEVTIPNNSGPDTPDISTHKGFSTQSAFCKNCHSVHRAKGSKKIFRKGSGDPNNPENIELCFTCHDGTGSTFNIRITFKAGAAHDVQWLPPADTGIKCTNCHHPHNASNYLGGVSGERMTKRVEENLCLGCHDKPISVNAFNIKEQFNRKSRHAITGTTADGLEGAKVECTSCHNPHVAQRGNDTPGSSFADVRRLIDPTNTFKRWEGTLVEFCLKCHNSENRPIKQASRDVFVPYTILFPDITDKPFFQGWDKTGFRQSEHGLKDFQCNKCHMPHGSNNPRLNAFFDPLKGYEIEEGANEENLCFNCHNDTKVEGAPDVRAVISKENAHPTISRRNRHADTESVQNIGQDNRHAECFDCHDPHQAKKGLHKENFAGKPQAGMKGIKVINGVPGITPNLFQIITPIVYEYQLCFKCHSAFADLLDNPIGDLTYPPKDKAAEFNTNNPSYHPVEALGKNLGIKDEAFALGTKFNPTTKDEPDYGLSSNFDDLGVKLDQNYPGKITCSDCHNNDDPNGAQGPHGSKYRKILRKPFYYKVDAQQNCMYGCHRLQATTPDGQFSEDGNSLCFSCHNKDVYYGGASGSRFVAKGTSGHALHTRLSEMAGKTSCFACHQPHGSDKDPALIRKISPNWNKDSEEVGVINYERTASGGSCESSCHWYPVFMGADGPTFYYSLAYPRVDASTLGTGLTYEESASQISYSGSWLYGEDTTASGGRYIYVANSYSNDKANAIFQFNGTEVSFISKLGPDGALANIYIDSQLQATIDTTALIDSWQAQVFKKESLESGNHTLTIELNYRSEANLAGTPANQQKLIIDAFTAK